MEKNVPKATPATGVKGVQTSRQNFEKSILIIIFSLIVGALLSPRIIFQTAKYEVGDVVPYDIVAEEDLLIEDKISTDLKEKQLLAELGQFFDYDPSLLDKTILNINKSFSEYRKVNQSIILKTEKLEKKTRRLGLDYFLAHQNLKHIEADITFFRNLRKLIKKQLKPFNETGEKKLSQKDFLIKQKLDNDYQIAQRLFKGLQEKYKIVRSQITELENQRHEQNRENKKSLQSIKEAKLEAKQNFLSTLQIKLSDKRLEQLDFDFYNREYENALIDVLEKFQSRKIVLSREIFKTSKKQKVTREIHNLLSGEKVIIDNIQQINDIESIQTLINKEVKLIPLQDGTGKGYRFLTMLANKLIKPTMTENKQEYTKRKEDILKSNSPVFFSLKKGEMIVRRGEKVNNQQAELIDSYYKAISNTEKITRIIGIVLIVFFITHVVYRSFRIRHRELAKSFRKLLLISIAIVISVLLTKGFGYISEMMQLRFTDVHSSTYSYIFPVALAAMLVGILIDFEAALMTGILSSIFNAIMMQNSLYYFLFSMVGCVIASLPITSFDSRYSLLKHGLKVSIVNIPIVTIIGMIEQNQLNTSIWPNLISAFSGGILTSILASVLLPIFESLFDITTNLKLMELANMNNPGLKKLIFQAPGTYHHSIIVGNLSETAATKIGANPLLCRVGSLYHDLGKTLTPQYFVENRSRQKNMHDELSPYESTRIIIEHIKKAAELFDKYRLGTALKDIMQQHHGTSLVKYFYYKAQKEAEITGEKVDENDFRYPGPKPQTKEAALVMVADSCEAAARSLTDPSTEEIYDLVHRLSWDILESGQLDESGLNLNEFRSIVLTYSSILISIHHQRIKYPGQDKAKRKVQEENKENSKEEQK